MNQLTIEFDGGASPNPGTGYGSFRVSFNSTVYPVEQRLFGRSMTNNQAEWDTLISAMRFCIIRFSAKECELLIRGDSQLVLFGFSGQIKTKKTTLIQRLDLARKLAKNFASCRVEWRKRDVSVEIFGH